MKLDILIPMYNEDASVVKSLLDSIAIQQNVDFDSIGVIICIDGGTTEIPEDFIKNYPFHIEVHHEPHRGVSGTRNACLDYSKADYVMFCDCDDMFFNACGLWMMFREMNGDGFDSMVSVFVEETRHPETKEPEYINREMDSTFVHGKIHKRQYLIKKGIRWNEKLTIHEDSYFNILCQNLSDKVKYCTTPFYLWKWRDDSVCRHDPKYILKTYNNMLDSNDQLVDEFLRRGIQDKAMFYSVMMIFDAYYTMNKEEWLNQENQEYRNATELRFADYYEKHKDFWNTMPMNDKMMISNQIRSRSVMEGMRMEAITIDAWLRHVEEMKGGDA